MAVKPKKDERELAFFRRVNKEIKKIESVMADVTEDKQKIVEGIIKRASFMRVTLEDYEEDLAKYGHTEMFTQSEKTDPYERERPVARLYNSMVKNYASVMKQLFDLLPNTPADVPDPAYEKFFGKSGGA